MVRPDYFGPNIQTAASNVFQKDSGNISKCLLEWEAMKNTLISEGIEVIEFEAIKNAPDAIFPNWFTTYSNQTLDLFPMEAPNRQLERANPSLNHLLHEYKIEIDFTEMELKGLALESTSSLVLDRINNIAYCSISSRSNLNLARDWAIKKGFELIAFHSSYLNKPIYHTNVVMWIGTSIAGICEDVINDDDLIIIKETLQQDKQILNLTIDQLGAYCGNMLEIKNKKGELLLLMSQSANHALTDRQKDVLQKFYTKLLIVDLANIEKIGGGSARCMVQELY